MSQAEARQRERALHGNRKLKIWVPETVFDALTRTASERDLPRPEWIRHILFSHLFGRVELDETIARLQAAGMRSYGREPLFSRRARDVVNEDNEPYLPLGKSTVDALVLVSDNIHAGLARMAERAGRPLGAYAAYVLCWAMFGRGVYARLALKVTRGMWLGDTHDEAETRRVDW